MSCLREKRVRRMKRRVLFCRKIRGDISEYIYLNRRNVLARRKALRLHATKAERMLWKYIRAAQLGVKFRRQYSIGSYIVDFCCPALSLIIELDGWVHGEEDVRVRDEKRQKWLESKGYVVKRYTNAQVKYELQSVLLDIVNTIRVLDQKRQ